MAIQPTRELKIGKIIDTTLAVLGRNAAPVLIYWLILAALSTPITYLTATSTAPLELLGAQLLKSVVGMVCGYFLLVTMVRRTGLGSRTGADELLPFIGMSLLASLAVIVGLFALVLPAIFLMARWSIAQPLLVARGGGAMASLGESWERTRGNEFSIIVAAFAVLLLPIVALIGASIVFEKGDLVGTVVSELASSGANLILLAMGVALFGLIVGTEGAPAPAA